MGSNHRLRNPKIAVLYRLSYPDKKNEQCAGEASNSRPRGSLPHALYQLSYRREYAKSSQERRCASLGKLL